MHGTVTYNADVKATMDLVTESELRPVVEDLSGARAATIGGSAYTFTTRARNSGTPIDKAEQYVYERLLSYPGLDSVSYFTFTGGSFGGRDVVAEIRGSSPTRADEIVIVTAHLDDCPWSGKAPGADDNASGVSAMLFLARKLAAREFECTIRFVATGDEEDSGAGASEYAAWCNSHGETVIGVYVPDMLAYDNGTHTIELYARPTASDPGGGDQAMAQMYADVIAAYGIGVTPVFFHDAVSYTDADSFWAKNLHALAVCEGWTPTNLYYHTLNDTVATLSWPYYVNTTKALLGAVAHQGGIDTTAPVTADNTTGLAYRRFTLVLTPDDAGTGVAATSYRVDGGEWQTGTSVVLRARIRHKRAGLSFGDHLIEYYSTDNGGNVETIKSCVVRIG